MEITYEKYKKKRPSWTKTLRRNLEYYALLGGVSLGKQLSLNKLQFLGRCLGKIAFYLLKKDKGIIEEQLAFVYPESPKHQRDQWTYECFLHFGQLLFEVFSLYHTSKIIEQNINIYGEELFEEGFARGKGIIVLGAHLGNWELLSGYFSKTGYSAKVAVKPLYDNRLNNFFIKLRKKEGITLIEDGTPKALKSILKCFKNNEVFFVLTDQDTNVSSMFVPFFGVLAHTPVVASHLALKTDALVISGIVSRKPNSQFDVIFERVGTFGKEKFDRYDTFEVSEQFNLHMEKIIRRYPSQWAWFHRRWKHKPQEKDLQFLQEIEQKRNHD